MARDSNLWKEAYMAKPKGTAKIKIKLHNKVSRPVKREVFIPHDSVALKARMKVIDAQMRELKAERKKINEQLKAPWRAGYDKKPWIVYVLRLQNDCWYVGITKDLQKRYKAHSKGKGAMWTKRFSPIEIYESRTTEAILESAASLIEDQVTFEYAGQYGIDKVRGGGYCQTKPNWPDYLVDGLSEFDRIA